MSSILRPPRPKRGRYFDKPTVVQSRLERERRRTTRQTATRKAGAAV